MEAVYIKDAAGKVVAYEITPEQRAVALTTATTSTELELRHDGEVLSVDRLVVVLDAAAGECQARVEFHAPTGSSVNVAHVIDEDYETVAVPWFMGESMVWAQLDLGLETTLTVRVQSETETKKRKFKIRLDPKDTQPPRAPG